MPAWETLRASPLMAQGGWWHGTLLSPAARAALAAEAVRSHEAAASEVYVARSPDEDVRRGNPARFLEWAPGGARLRAFYRAAPLAALLQRLTGLAWTRSGEQPSYSFYRRPGHHLGVHRDIDTCDLAVIACVLEERAPASGLAGALCVWPERTGERLRDIRLDPERGRMVVRLAPGEAIVLLGGLIPHQLLAIEGAHVRVVAPLCFQVA